MWHTVLCGSCRWVQGFLDVSNVCSGSWRFAETTISDPGTRNYQIQSFISYQQAEGSFWTRVGLVGCHNLIHIRQSSSPTIGMTLLSVEQKTHDGYQTSETQYKTDNYSDRDQGWTTKKRVIATKRTVDSISSSKASVRSHEMRTLMLSGDTLFMHRSYENNMLLPWRQSFYALYKIQT